ncbi:hypothetical protein [Paucibacter sp. XJ19-41]|uniref:hypothetical protein n=1 Tax=Paucibacter sp. XJ19-41 TaxID=2927824 RepID=UPI002349E154|nr:hypothetical protein [Paucibacter sp. XJ19-41]MDC6170950.1 hypothetical protein [Paucibacter sp. XJ19-41]
MSQHKGMTQMTRWIQEFQQTPFKTNWDALLGAVWKLEADDETIAPTVEELARLRKALAFVDRIISDVDLELTPRSVWSTAQAQIDACMAQVQAYESNRNQAHLVQANEHADNLLTYFRPYMVTPAEAIEAHSDAVRAFAEHVEGYAASMQAKGTEALSTLSAAVAKSQGHQEALEVIEQRVRAFDAYLFEGVGDAPPAADYMKQMVDATQKDQRAIEALHVEVAAKHKSAVAVAEVAETDIARQVKDFSDLLDAITLKHKELSRFYQKIFGRPISDDDDMPRDGLEQELDARLNQLTKYEAEQQTRHRTLFEKIDGLLPGAASAGLATAYQALSKQFEGPVKQYTKAFYIALLVLLLCGLVVVIDAVTFSPFHIEFVKGRNWEELLLTVLTRIPILLPVIWFAIFSATRRSQYERLQQEYAHKQALASSYESYKKQLQDLKVDADELQRELIAKTIDAVTFNASKTLDGNHSEKLPAMQLLEKLSVDEVKKLLELIKTSKATS